MTIAALAWNEVAHLPACFRSLAPLIERDDVETLIVLDSRADEATNRAAHSAAQRVLTNPFANFSSQRNYAIAAAKGKWVFFIDPDERCTPLLAEEIIGALDQQNYSAYAVPRRNILFGHEVKHTGWWPDYQVRLLKTDAVHYDDTREVHEYPMVQGETGKLVQPLIHYNYDTWGQFVTKQLKYASLEARALDAAGRVARPRSLIGMPLRELQRRLIKYRGYRDGALGLALSVAMSIYVAETYRRLWVMQHTRR